MPIPSASPNFFTSKLPVFLEDLVSCSFQADSRMVLGIIVAELEKHPDFPGVMIIEQKKLLGMISRNDCFEKLSRPFSLDLFLNKPVREFLSRFTKSFEILPTRTRIEDAVPIVLDRPASELYEPIVIALENEQFRIVDVHDILLAQSQLLKTANLINLKRVEIARSLANTLELKKVVDLIGDNLMEFMPDAQIMIALNVNGCPEVQAARGFMNSLSLEKAKGFIRNRFSFNQFSFYQSPVYLSMPVQEYELKDTSQLAQFWLIFPLIHSDELVAIIIIGRFGMENVAERAFEYSEIENLTSLSPMYATAIRNAQLYQEVQHLAVTDPLTQIYNRRGLFAQTESKVNQQPPEGEPLAALMIDIDHFKQINDRYGHIVGDQIIQSLASYLHQSIRSGDQVGRFGGDEFVIILNDCMMDVAIITAERIREGVSRLKIKIMDDVISFTISIGVAKLSHERESMDILLLHADQALYIAKQNGRNQIYAWDNLSKPAA